MRIEFAIMVSDSEVELQAFAATLGTPLVRARPLGHWMRATVLDSKYVDLTLRNTIRILEASRG